MERIITYTISTGDSGENVLGFLRKYNLDKHYKMNIEAGDYKEETVWIPTKYEGYQIGNDKFAMLREVPGQHKDLTNLYECKLSYIGSTYDNLNSSTTSLVDRMKYYQYFFNILWYRIELLIGSDGGEKCLEKKRKQF